MNQPPPTVPVCYRHPSRETYLRCARCDRPICPDCMNEAAVGHQCPECLAEGRRTQRAARTAFGGSATGRMGYATKTLIGLNIGVAVLAAVAGGADAVAGGTGAGGLLGSATPVHRWGAMLGLGVFEGDFTLHGVAAGEVYRLLTSMFLHFGLLHLLMNMWALWVLGRALEEELGPARFLTLYFVAGLGGSVAVYLFSAPNTLTAGASGAIFGLFAGLFVVLRKMRRDTSAVVPILVINLVITFVVPFISMAGHLGGLVTGALVAAALAYAPRAQRTLIQSAAVAALGVTMILLVVFRTAMLTG